MKLFRAIREAWRRWRLTASAPPCPVCGAKSPRLRPDTPLDVPMWSCSACQAMWWQAPQDKRPVGYAHEQRWSEKTWQKVLEKPVTGESSTKGVIEASRALLERLPGPRDLTKPPAPK